MPPSAVSPDSDAPHGQVPTEPGASRPDSPQTTHNLLTLAGYDVVLRTGWIFKTESVVMPAFLDLVAGAGWLRGCLLVVNRFGQSIPPAFYARRLAGMPLKKRSLFTWTFLMGLPFAVLAIVWSVVGNSPPSWMASLFLVCYGVFSCCHGLNQISYSTLQGKLVPVHLRGRLMLLSIPTGSACAILFAWWLMGDWLRRPDGGFTYIFGFTALLFALAAATGLLMRERPDERPRPATVVQHPLASAWSVFRGDADFRRLAMVVMLAVVGTVLFPHYQALARERLKLTGGNLMVWVIVQNGALGVFGVLLGSVVERRGERLGLRLAIAACALAPLTALVLAYVEPDVGKRWFWVVFIPLGMTPLSLKTMVGYTLEIAPAGEHPRYLSALSLTMAVPFCFSPLVGWCVDLFDFEAVFIGGAVLIALAALLTFRLVEPRHNIAGAAQAMPAADD
jgi:hypothetical protein